MAKETIKVRVAVTVEVDYAEWANLYDVGVSEVRDDVKTYVANLVHRSAAQDAGAITVVKFS